MTQKNKKNILWFSQIGINDVSLVGGKNAALGEMYQELTKRGIKIPDGFAISAFAYRMFIKNAGLEKTIHKLLQGINTKNIKELQRKGSYIRSLIMNAPLPASLTQEIIHAYEILGKKYNTRYTDVAVRSSATAEDLPGASFAGQQETYLNIVGPNALLIATKKAFASLFTDRAISYRVDKGFSHSRVSLSVGVQKMVRSDKASSGVIFTIDTESGFHNVIVITGSYGLGEMIVQGQVTPDEFVVFKPTLKKNYPAIISKNIGIKNEKLIYDTKKRVRRVTVPHNDRERFCLNNSEITLLAKWSIIIEEHFSRHHGHYQPMDIEWAKDGRTKELFIVQARPETVHSSKNKNIYTEYTLRTNHSPLIQGIAVGKKIASGKANIINNASNIKRFRKGEVLVTDITDPDWEPIMKIASAIVTNKGGRTSHAAIVSRELGIPAIVGTERATTTIKQGQAITIDCSKGQTGNVYAGILPYKIIEHRLDKIPKTKTKIMVNIGSPDEAFENHFLPAQGVGLGRLEFIIASHIKIHPNALIYYKKLKQQALHDTKIKNIIYAIDKLTKGYANKTDYYVNELAEGIAKIGAAFWPHEVIIRFSDFKTNEYRTLIGGELFEPKEENPMLGWRGASRYYDPKFSEAFGLECKALKKARTYMGLTNISAMIPFCRTPQEGKKVLSAMARYGLSKKHDASFKTYVMCEIPSNIILAEQFLSLFDGMSIGSNDLTQLVLGLDRDSGIVSHIANENNPSVKNMIADIIAKARKAKKYIGICGQAPSDYPEFAAFLVRKRINSISLNPDSIITATMTIHKQEKKMI